MVRTTRYDCLGFLLCLNLSLTGDKIPNSGGEVHLEAIPVTEIWAEYKRDMENFSMDLLQYVQFLNMMDSCFPHVKIRQTKQVTGMNETRLEFDLIYDYPSWQVSVRHAHSLLQQDRNSDLERCAHK